MSYKTQAKKLYQMIGEGKLMDAFEHFYHDRVIMQENNNEPRRGKENNRKHELDWLKSIEKVHDGGVSSITSDEEKGITSVEAWIDVEFKNGKRIKMDEGAVQQWDGDQIVNERFYYNLPDAA